MWLKLINRTFGLSILNQNEDVGKENAISVRERIVVPVYRIFLLVTMAMNPIFLVIKKYQWYIWKK